MAASVSRARSSIIAENGGRRKISKRQAIIKQIVKRRPKGRSDDRASKTAAPMCRGVRTRPRWIAVRPDTPLVLRRRPALRAARCAGRHQSLVLPALIWNEIPINSSIVCRKCQRLGRAACFCWLDWGEVVPIRQVGRAPEEEAGAKASGARKAGENRRERMPAARPSSAGSTAGTGRQPPH